jgi:NAD(P)-dependent dehydrogenase (short-subunit alcohol dehydrogenase family)
MTNQRSVLVTGTSTGIGRATVAALVDGGFHVFATVRRTTDVDALTEEFTSAVTPLLMDLEDDDSIRAAGAHVCAAGPLFGLVNNAGAAMPGPLEYLPIDTFRRQIAINLTAQLLVTQVMLPALRESAEQTGDARIVMIGSVGGRIAGPILGAYAAAKHGLVGLSSSLRAELAPSGIKVILIEPGSIATPIWGRGQTSGDATRAQSPAGYDKYARQLEGSAAMSKRGAEKGLAAAVPAGAIRAALTDRNPAPRQSVGRDARVIGALVRVLPFRAVYRMTRAKV